MLAGTFERFTEEARMAVAGAQAEARELGHDYIGTEHLLLGVIRQHEGDVARALRDRGVDLERARGRLLEIVPAAAGESSGHLPFTPRSKQTLELALRESLSHGHYAVAPEHLLLGLLRVREGLAVRILGELGVDTEALGAEVVGMLPSPGEGGEAHHPQSRRMGAVHRPQGGTGIAPAVDLGFRLEPSAELRRLLMSAGARALEAGRTEITIADVEQALRPSRSDEPPSAATA